MPSAIFASRDVLQRAFARGLERLLVNHRELGVFILVLANAAFDRALRERLAAPLEHRLRSLGSDAELTASAADGQVFRRIGELGMDALWPVKFRRLGPWELQYNPMRALRPVRSAAAVADAIRVDFDRHEFNFGAPFLRKEILWHGHIAGRSAAIFFNKFPFVELHSILVPEPGQGRPQFLTRRDQEFLWRAAETLGTCLPGIGFGYNSYGAHASVNHLHFQLCCRREPLAITNSKWRHNGGQTDYPLRCHRFDAAAEAWAFIDELHRDNCSYNLIQLPGRLYCVPRRKQGDYRVSDWSEGLAWYETAGGFITSAEGEFERLVERDLVRALARLALR